MGLVKRKERFNMETKNISNEYRRTRFVFTYVDSKKTIKEKMINGRKYVKIQNIILMQKIVIVL